MVEWGVGRLAGALAFQPLGGQHGLVLDRLAREAGEISEEVRVLCEQGWVVLRDDGVKKRDAD